MWCWNLKEQEEYIFSFFKYSLWEILVIGALNTSKKVYTTLNSLIILKNSLNRRIWRTVILAVCLHATSEVRKKVKSVEIQEICQLTIAYPIHLNVVSYNETNGKFEQGKVILAVCLHQHIWIKEEQNIRNPRNLLIYYSRPHSLERSWLSSLLC